MPIKGLTDRQAMFPEIGRIRKGAPKEPKKPGKDLTYFRVEFDEREKEAIKVFHETYGGKPTELNVLLPFNSVDENFEAWREAYVAGGLIHRCDGERVWYEVDPVTGEAVIVNGLPIKRCDGFMQCKPTGRLKVIIPELHRLAFLTALTGSYHDVINISRQLEAILQINGKLAGVPLKFRRRPMKISTPSGPDGKRARRIKHLLSIEADPEWVKAKLTAMKIAALPDNGMDLPQLEAPQSEIVDVEFEEEEWSDEDEVEEIIEDEEPIQNSNGRPYPAAVAREKIEQFAEHPDFKGRRRDEKRGEKLSLETAVVLNLNLCFEGNPDPDKDRHTVLGYISRGESASIKDDFWTGAKLCAIEKWLEVKEWEGHGSGYLPRKESRLEAVSMVVERMKEQGQAEMSL